MPTVNLSLTLNDVDLTKSSADIRAVLDAAAKAQAGNGSQTAPSPVTPTPAAPAPEPTPAPTTPTPAPPPPAPASVWPPAAAPQANDTISLDAQTYQGSANIDVPVTIKGKGMRQTILDGQRGAGGGHRLAWGKGIVHAHGGPVFTIQDVGFINGGGGDGVSDAEAGVYAEDYDGQLKLIRCAFDNCENGIFIPWLGLAAVDAVLDGCVFGRSGPNGLGDGRSHDLYVAGRSLAIRNSVFVGSSRGNTVKCRGPKLTLENNYIGRTNGRWVDCPGGTDVVSKGNVYVTVPGSNVQNALGFFDENDAGVTGTPGSLTSDGDTFYFSRSIGEHIWIANADARVTFTNTKVFWVGRPGAAPPPVIIDGPGQITGPNPFILNADNRVDAPPAPPADPAAP